MTRGHPTARTRAWQVQKTTEAVSDVVPPFLDEVHPSDRAFNTLSTILQAALVTAQAENSKTIVFLQSAFTWFKDCYEWNQEAQHARADLQQQVHAKQKEFEALNSELMQVRDRLALIQQHQPQKAPHYVRDVELNLDGNLDHYRSVIVSLQAKVARREESLVHLRSTLAHRTQELIQARHDVAQAMDIATTQMEARIQQLDLVVQVHEQKPVVQACVLPVLRSSPLRCLRAWAMIAAFRRTQRMVLRRSYMDSISMAYTSWRRNTYPRVGRHVLVRQLEDRTLSSYCLELEHMAWRDWIRAVFHLSAARLAAWRQESTPTLAVRLILAADTKLRNSSASSPFSASNALLPGGAVKGGGPEGGV